jgi:hypothetical protein
MHNVSMTNQFNYSGQKPTDFQLHSIVKQQHPQMFSNMSNQQDLDGQGRSLLRQRPSLTNVSPVPHFGAFSSPIDPVNPCPKVSRHLDLKDFETEKLQPSSLDAHLLQCKVDLLIKSEQALKETSDYFNFLARENTDSSDDILYCYERIDQRKLQKLHQKIKETLLLFQASANSQQQPKRQMVTPER